MTKKPFVVSKGGSMGVYYLHENGELIYKPSDDSWWDIKDSDFSIMLWLVDSEDRESAWKILVESSALGANETRINQLAQRWGCDDADAEIYAKRIGVTFHVNDGVVTASPINNDAVKGSGGTRLNALISLCKNTGFRACKFGWSMDFKEQIAALQKQKTKD